MLKQKNRLKKPREFTFLYNRGKKKVGRFLVVYFRKRSQEDNRIGFTVSKKVGNAVIRNHIKRQLREIVRLHPLVSGTGMDIVIIARRSAVNASYQELCADLESLLPKYADEKET